MIKPIRFRTNAIPPNLPSGSIRPIMLFVPIEDHPKFSKPNIRFRHAAKRPKLYAALAKVKSMGIETFIDGVMEYTPLDTPPKKG